MSIVESKRAAWLRRPVCAALALATIAGISTAQSQTPASLAASSAAEDAAVRKQLEEMPGRNRALMHPGNPLEISGREQGDNLLRTRTPALVNSDRKSAQVDPDENYRRTLALYENRSTLLAAPLSSQSSAVAAAPAIKKRTRAPIAPADSEHSSSMLIGLGLGVLAAVWFTRRLTASFFASPPRSARKMTPPRS